MRASWLVAGFLLSVGIVALLVPAPGTADVHDGGPGIPPIMVVDLTPEPAFGDIDQDTEEVSFVVHLFRWTEEEYAGEYELEFEVDDDRIARIQGFWQPGTRHVNVSTVEDADQGPGVWEPSVGLHRLNATTRAAGDDFTFPIRLPLGPDLAPTALDTRPQALREGDEVTFEATVDNHGLWRTPHGEDIPVTLVIDEEPIVETSITDVPEGGQATVTFEEAWTAIPGEHAVTIRVDEHAVEETSTRNNNATYRIDVEPAGLMIEHLDATPNPGPPDEPVTVHATIANRGDDEEPPATVHLTQDGTLTAETTTPGLGPGEEANLTWTLEPPIGLHELQAALEPHDEDAPRAPSGPTAHLLVGPDVAIETLTVDPPAPIEGERFSVTATITNQGTSTDEPIDVVLFATQDKDDAREQNLHGTTLDGLDADERTPLTLNATLDPGTYTMTVQVDPLEEIQEATRDENTAETSLLVRVDGPDPILDRLHITPEKPQAGDTVRIEANILNQGAQPTSGHHARIFTQDGPLGDDAPLPDLDPGASTTITRTWTPEAGAHDMIVHLGTTTQLDRGDPHHTATRSIPVAPSGAILEPSDLRTDPPDPAVGVQARALVNVTNTGDEPSGPFEVRFATNATIDTVTVEGLEPGETRTLEAPWTPKEPAWSLEATLEASDRNPRSIDAAPLTLTGQSRTMETPIPGVITTLALLIATIGTARRRT